MKYTPIFENRKNRFMLVGVDELTLIIILLDNNRLDNWIALYLESAMN